MTENNKKNGHTMRMPFAPIAAKRGLNIVDVSAASSSGQQIYRKMAAANSQSLLRVYEKAEGIFQRLAALVVSPHRTGEGGCRLARAKRFALLEGLTLSRHRYAKWTLLRAMPTGSECLATVSFGTQTHTRTHPHTHTSKLSERNLLASAISARALLVQFCISTHGR